MPFRSRSTHPLDAAQASGTDGCDMPHKTGFLSTFKMDFHAALLEFCGTTTFLTLAFGGTQAASVEATTEQLVLTSVERTMSIALSFGLSLLVSAWLFFRVTGGLFNPNVSLALLLVGVIGPLRFILYCVAQLAGGIAAAALILALTPGRLQCNTLLAPGVNLAQGVFIEAFITAALCLAVLMLAAEKHVSTPFAPIGIGLTLLTCHLFAIYYTGAGMNTARSFGPAVVTGFPHSSHWVYWVGPFFGSLIAATFYSFLIHYEYWNLTPGQDDIDTRGSPDDPVARIVRSSKSGSRSRVVASSASSTITEVRPNDSVV